MNITRRVRQTTRTIVSAIDPRHVELGFLLILLIGVAYQVVRGVDYPRLAGHFPVIVGVPTVGLLLFVLKKRLSAWEPRDSQLDEAALADRLLLAQGVAWVLLLFVFVVVFGLTIGCSFFLILYYRFKRELSWPRLFTYLVLFLLFVIFVFQAVLQIPVYEGLLGLPQTIPM